MDDRKLNPLRALIGLGIIAYFAWLFAQPNPSQQEALVIQSPQPNDQATQTPVLTTTTSCPAQIEQVGLSVSEIRLRINGTANTILVYADQGNVTASTTEAGSGGEYRVRTPGPATAVQLDNCPPLNLR